MKKLNDKTQFEDRMQTQVKPLHPSVNATIDYDQVLDSLTKDVDQIKKNQQLLYENSRKRIKELILLSQTSIREIEKKTKIDHGNISRFLNGNDRVLSNIKILTIIEFLTFMLVKQKLVKNPVKVSAVLQNLSHKYRE